MFPKITIIWRPNVWKSSFFNAFVGHKIAIVADEPWTTRDISEYEYNDINSWLTYIIADSWWLDSYDKENEISKDIIKRTKEAIKDSNLLIFVIEYDKFTQLDEDVLKIIKKSNFKDYILVANKADNENMILESFSFSGKSELWFFPVSVSHTKWFDEIKKFIWKFLVSKWLNYKIDDDEEDDNIKLAIIWRPNVGKSSILNSLVWKNRVMVQDESGTTRDSIDTKFNYKWKDFTLIDTAWIRRLSKVWVRNIENRSVMRSERAIKRADIVSVIIDAYEWVVQQDLNIISQVLEEKKWLIVVFNKWDKVLAKPWIDKENIMDRYINYLKEKIDFLPWVSIIFTSAIWSKRLDEILKRAWEISLERSKRVKTAIFNEFIEQAVYKHPPSWNKKSHNPKIYYWSQVDVNPPKFILSVNNPNHFHFSYKRYLENRIRDNFWFFGTPIILEYRWRGKSKDIVK